MKTRKGSGLFGQTDIPPLSPSKLTAYYKANAWSDIQRVWKISMYPTSPESKQPLDMPTAILTSASMRGQAASVQGDSD